MANKNYRREAFKAYEVRIGEWLPVALVLLIVTASTAALSLLSPLWMLAGIALFVLPTVFASTQYLGACFSGKSLETNVISRGFIAYFKMPSVGVYRFFFNGLLTFASAVGVGVAFYSIYYIIGPSFSAEIKEAVEALTAAVSAGDSEAASSILYSNPVFVRMFEIYDICVAFALIFFAWLYFGHYGQNGIVRNAFSVGSPRLANFYYKHYRLTVKKDWVPTRAPFLAFPLVFLGLGIAVSAICYAFGVKLNFAIFFGTLTFAVLYALYLPLAIYLHASFAFDHESSIGKAFYKGSQYIYRVYAQSGRANDEELARMREELDKMKPHDDDTKEG